MKTKQKQNKNKKKGGGDLHSKGGLEGHPCSHKHLQQVELLKFSCTRDRAGGQSVGSGAKVVS